MKKITMLFFFLLSVWFTYGQEVTIGTGTLTERHPFGTTWGYERSAALYTSTEIGQAGFINQLAWNIGSLRTASRPVKIYLKETTATTITAADWSSFTTGATLVYEGTMNPTATGFYAFAFGGSFSYSGGTNNLLVLVETNYGGSGLTGASYDIKGTATSGMHFEARKDSSPPTDNLSEVSGGFRPNLRITFGDEILCAVIAPSIVRLTSSSVEFNVTERTTTQSIYYEVRTAGAAGSGATGLVASGTVTDLTSLPIVVNGLTADTNYTIYTRANCADQLVGDFSPAVNFKTSEVGVIGGGAGRVDNYLPLYSYNGYNYSQMIYTAEEIGDVLGDNVLVQRIKFFYTGTGTVANYNTWKVYLTNTTKGSFTGTSASDWMSHSQFSQVFEGTVSLVANNWTEIVFDTPFEWDGVSNLAIAVYENAAGYSSGSSFSTYATNGYRGILRSADAFFTPEGGNASAYGRYQYLPRLFIQGVELPSCYFPINVNATNVTASSVQLNWGLLTGSETNGIDYYIATSNTAPTETTTPTATLESEEDRSLVVSNLQERTTYYVWMRNICADNSRTTWTTKPIVFTTSLVAATLPFEDDFQTEGSYGFANHGRNKWFIGTATNVTEGAALFISSDEGVTNRYLNSITQVSHVFKDFTIPTGAEQVEILFNWRSVGDAYDYDGFRVWIVPTSYEPTAGTEITNATGRKRLGRTIYAQNANFINEHLVFNVADLVGENFRLVFEWKQNDYSGDNPPAAIRELKINYASCTQPADLVLDEVTSDSVKVTWEEVEDVEQYEAYISTSSTEPTTETVGTVVDGTTYTFEDLDSNTEHYIWVRSLCSATNQSLWKGPLIVKTTLVPATLPYSYGFEGDEPYAFVNHTTNKWHIGTAVQNGGTQSLYISNDNGVKNEYNPNRTQTSHVYKDFSIPAGAAELEVQFDWRSMGDTYNYDFFTVWAVPVGYQPTAGSDISTGSGRVRLGRTMYSQNPAFTAERIVVNISAFAGQTMRLVFQWKNNDYTGVNPPAAIDNLKLNYSSCLQPQNLMSETITTTSVKAKWDAVTGVSNYEAKITTAPTPPAETVAGATVSTTNHTFTGLTSNTDYYIWVRSLCTTTNKSLWKGPLKVTTALVPVNLPFRDTFEIDQPYARVNDEINKWYTGNATSNGGQRSLYISGNGGSANEYISNSTSQVSHVYKDFIIPTGAGNIGINFDWRLLGESSDFMRVWLVPITYSPVPRVQTTVANSGGVQIGKIKYNLNSIFRNERIVIDGSAYAGQTMRLLFEWTNDSWSEYQPPAAIDNLEIAVITCTEPAGVVITDVTSTSITVGWTVVEGQSDYEIYYSTTNVGLPGDTVTGSVTTTDNPYTIERLTPNTRYYIWVRSICSATSKSLWVPISVVTGQIPAEVPFDEKFEGDDNWTVGSNTINRWVIGRAISNGGSKSLYISNDGGLSNVYDVERATIAHAYRDIAIPAGVREGFLSFDWRCMGQGFSEYKYDYFKVWLVPVTYSPIAGEQITEGDDRVQIGGVFNGQGYEFVRQESVLNLTAYAGSSVRLVFEWTQNEYSGEQPPAAIDNVKITVITCPGVENLQSEILDGAPSRVSLTWDTQGIETQWEVYIVPLDNEVLPGNASTGIIVDTNSYVFVNPNPTGDDQFYRFYVRPICSDTDKGRWSKVGIISFIPPPGCANVEADIEFSDLEGLEKNANGEYVICEKGTFNFELGASYYDILKTNSYEVSSIEYKPPFPFKGGGAVELTSDDVWSDVIDLGFDFCFYGNKYDKALINTNGTISFSIQGVVPGGRYVPRQGGAPYWPTGLIPSDPGGSQGPTINSIMGVFQDTHPGEDKAPADHSINYQIIGKAPCRTLVFNVYRLGMYGSGSGCAFNPDDVDGTTQTSQIVIYEGTNIIEVYVKNRHSLCDEWSRNAIIGLQNADGTAGIAPPGRNTGPWSTQNEAWRFTPNGDSTAEFSWEKDGEFFSSEAKIDIAVTETVTYTAKAKYEICGDETVLFKEFKFVKEDFSIGTPNDLIRCTSLSGEELFVDLNDNDSAVLGSLDPEKYDVSYFESEEDMNAHVNVLDPIYKLTANRTFYVKLTNKRTGCSEFKTFKAIVKPPLEVTKLENEDVCGAFVFPELAAGEAYYTEEYGKGNKYEAGDSYSEIGVRTFYIYREDENGCSGQTSFSVEVIDEAIADDIADQTFMCDIYFLPEPSKYNKYFTQPDGKGEELKAGAPVIKPQTIYVYAYNKGKRGTECIDEKSFTISYEDCPIPKGISPNGDGLNDTFDLSQHGISKIQIFNRNGVEVYSHGLGYKKEWFGQNNSDKLLPVGTYYYVVVSNGKVRTGWVQLNY
ncbi:fibronectin type III domain-containing protein [Myroides sp. WP-1]|uniref:fibronectin type III domain-containing protein n=1 Tax=Myroides sp. WP-1 TaxID=2759944 RepID=UPI0015F92AF9|nr:fibronectin type III domain-containing protein [Myroides sp. WP-1]MBB1140964.1 fibronectin type III domain-containing protein [Myroides sp. WP-1]